MDDDSGLDHGAFRGLDLNLLVALDALLQESSVGRAAERLHLGQPAMSHALARLRAVFDDELMYRDGARMRLTPRALALAGPLRRVLGEVHQLTRLGRPFDPARAEGKIRIALNDPLEALLLPGLMNRLWHRAPGLALAVAPLPASRHLEALDAGEISLAVGYFPRLREVHHSRPLHVSGFACVYNPALVSLPEAPGLVDLAVFPHIHTTYTGEPPGVVDRVFEAHGLARRVVARSATPLSIPFVIKRSPLVAILPDLLARLFAAHADLRFVPLPIPGLELPLSLVGHRRDQGDPLQAFVAGLVVESLHEWLVADGASGRVQPLDPKQGGEESGP